MPLFLDRFWKCTSVPRLENPPGGSIASPLAHTAPPRTSAGPSGTDSGRPRQVASVGECLSPSDSVLTFRPDRPHAIPDLPPEESPTVSPPKGKNFCGSPALGFTTHHFRRLTMTISEVSRHWLSPSAHSHS